MRAWLFQDSKQKKKLSAKAPWSVGWYDPNGRKRSKRIGSKSQAEKFRRKLEGELAANLYRTHSRKKWTQFRKEYEKTMLPRLAPGTTALVKTALDHFERICKPQLVNQITTATIDQFVVRRQTEPGKKRKSTISPATVNRDLRHLKAVIRIANEWGYLASVPKFRKVRELEEIGPVVTPEHFKDIYEACSSASKPEKPGSDATAWWQALLVFALTTGWRIEEILCLDWRDVDLRSGKIITRAGTNKGKRDDVDHLVPVAVEHLQRVTALGILVFDWPHNRRTLDTEFHGIQKTAGIDLPCPHQGEHECSESCHRYGFHAIRRAYATLNADTLPAPVLQKKMRHRSFTTTLRYIALADKLKAASEQVHVPEFLKRGEGEK